MLVGHIFHHNYRYISHLLSSILLAFSLLSGWLSVYKSPIVFAADASPIVADPAHTQDFFAAFGDASVQRGADGSWSQVVLTPAQQDKTGAVTLNNRIDLKKDFQLKYSVMLSKGDGMSFDLHPGQIGAVGMFGGNMGFAGLPNAIGFKLDTYPNADTNQVNGTSPDTIWGFRTFVQYSGFDVTIAPDGKTIAYTEQLRKANKSGAVWGDIDKGLSIPYGSFMETNAYGSSRIMRAKDSHVFLGVPIGDQLKNPTPVPAPMKGQVNDGPVSINSNGTNFADGHGMASRLTTQLLVPLGRYRSTYTQTLTILVRHCIGLPQLTLPTSRGKHIAKNSLL